MSQIISNKILPTTIGFDNIFRILEDIEKTSKPTYPPYSIYKESETNYVIEIAVAGFKKENLLIETKNNILNISGIHEKTEKNYLHRGISTKDFNHTFRLVDNCIIKTASIIDGILKIDLELIVPQEKLPRRIPIVT